jgi:hypothetical protein
MRLNISTGLALAALALLAGRLCAADVPKQVQLNVTVAEIDKACLETLGLANSTVIMETGCCQDFLDNRHALGIAKRLCEPKLMTTCGQLASLMVGGSHDVPIQQATIPYGVQLSLTPELVGTTAVRLAVGIVYSRMEPTAKFTPVPGITLEQPTISIVNLETTVEVPLGQTVMVGVRSPGHLHNPLLVCITPNVPPKPQPEPAVTSVATPRRQASQPVIPVPALPHAKQPAAPPAVIQAAYPRLAVAANVSVEPKCERWTFTANGGQLVVRAEGGQQLVAKELMMPIDSKDFRFMAMNGKVMLAGAGFHAMANTVAFDRLSGKLEFKGDVEFAGQSLKPRVEVQGEEVSFDLRTGSLLVNGLVKASDTSGK